jgi:hypothetical protein
VIAAGMQSTVRPGRPPRVGEYPATGNGEVSRVAANQMSRVAETVGRRLVRGAVGGVAAGLVFAGVTMCLWTRPAVRPRCRCG